ncbi:MAG: GTP cyclohydrolase II [Sandaracinaceae bacterium]
MSSRSSWNTVETPHLVRYAEADVPTEYATFRLVVYREKDTQREHVAVVKGNVQDESAVHVRVHSECLTGEVLHSMKCDCREQLDLALRHIADRDHGAVLYLRQEGRGIGLGNKIRAYALQQQGIDTVDANRMLGFGDDLRRYDIAADMLNDLGIRSVVLLTNNPAKVDGLTAQGTVVEDRLPVRVEPHEHNRDYLLTKRARMGHLLSDLSDLLLDAE